MRQNKLHGSNAGFLAPMYLFTVIFLIGPFVYMLVLSFLTRAETWGVVSSFTLRNYQKILEPVYMRTFAESLKLALLVTALITLIGYPFGYFMARLPAKRRSLMLMLVMIPFWTSSLIRLYGWIIIFRSNGVLDSLLMGMGLTDAPLKLLFSYEAVVVGMIYALLPMMILSVYSSASKLDFELVAAARDLGASRFTAFRTIALPLTMPGLFSGVILTFIPAMGLFFIADILGGNKIVLVGSLIQQQLTKGRNIPFAAALSVVLLLLTSILIRLYRVIFKTNKLEGLV